MAASSDLSPRRSGIHRLHARLGSIERRLEFRILHELGARETATLLVRALRAPGLFARQEERKCRTARICEVPVEALTEDVRPADVQRFAVEGEQVDALLWQRPWDRAVTQWLDVDSACSFGANVSTRAANFGSMSWSHVVRVFLHIGNHAVELATVDHQVGPDNILLARVGPDAARAVGHELVECGGGYA